jgi:excisionase family DNA binding protein
MNKDDVLMTRREVMEYLKISHNLMHVLIKERAFPSFRLKGRKLLFKKSDIDKWLESKRVR